MDSLTNLERNASHNCPKVQPEQEYRERLESQEGENQGKRKNQRERRKKGEERKVGDLRQPTKGNKRP